MNLNFSFFAFLLFVCAPVQAQIQYDRENPKVVLCNDCFSTWDFEVKAKDGVPVNQSHHVLVFNPDSQEFKTYFVVNIYERELGLEFNDVISLSNLPEHTEDLYHYSSLFTFSRAPRKPVELEYPLEKQPGNYTPSNYVSALGEYGYWARGELTKGRTLNLPVRVPVTIKFKNGWTVTLIIDPLGTAHQLVMIRDDNGDIVELGTDFTGGNTSGGSTFGDNIIIQIPSNNRIIRVCTGTIDNMACRDIPV